jgi:hypothetical protein
MLLNVASYATMTQHSPHSGSSEYSTRPSPCAASTVPFAWYTSRDRFTRTDASVLRCDTLILYDDDYRLR